MLSSTTSYHSSCTTLLSVAEAAYQIALHFPIGGRDLKTLAIRQLRSVMLKAHGDRKRDTGVEKRIICEMRDASRNPRSLCGLRH